MALPDALLDVLRWLILALLEAQERGVVAHVLSLAFLSSVVVATPIALLTAVYRVANPAIHTASSSKSIDVAEYTPRRRSKFSVPVDSEAELVDTMETVALLESLRANLACLNDVNDASSSELRSASLRLQAREAELSRLEDDRVALALERDRLASQMAALEGEVLALKSQSLALISQDLCLQDASGTAEGLELVCADLRQRLEQVEETKRCTDEQLVVSAEEASQLSQLVSRLEVELDGLREDYQKQSLEHANSVCEVELLSQAAATSSRDARAAREELQLLATQLEELTRSHVEIVPTVGQPGAGSEVADLLRVRAALEDDLLAARNTAAVAACRASILKSELSKQSAVHSLYLKEQAEETASLRQALESQRGMTEELLEVNTKAVAEIDEMRYALSISSDKLRLNSDRYSSEKSQFEAEAEAVLGRVDALVLQLKESEAARAVALSSAADMQAMAKDMNLVIKAMESSETHLSGQVAALEKKLKESKLEVSESDRERDRLLQELGVKDVAVQQLQDDLSRVAEALSTSSVETASLREKVQEREDAILSLEAQVTDIRTSLELARSIADKREEELVQSQSLLSEHITRNEHLAADLARQTVRVKLAAKDNQRKMSITQDLLGESESRLALLAGDLTATHQKLGDVELELKSTALDRTSMEGLHERIRSLEADLQRAMDSQVEEIRLVRDMQSDRGSEAVNGMREELDRSVSLLRAAEDRQTALQAEADRQLMGTMQSLNECQSRMLALQETHRETEASFAEREAEATSKIAAREESLALLASQMASLQSELKDARETAEALFASAVLEKNGYAADHASVQSLEQEIVAVRAELAVSEERLDDARAELTRSSETHVKALAGMQEQLQDAQDTLLQSEQRVALLQSELSLANERLSALVAEKELLLLNTENEAEHAEAIAALEFNLQRLTSQLEEERTTWAHVDEHMVKLEKQIEEQSILVAGVPQLEALEEEHRATVERLSVANAQLETELLMVRGEVLSASHRYGILKSEVARQAVAHKLATTDASAKIALAEETKRLQEIQIRELTVCVENLRADIESLQLERVRLVSSAAAEAEDHRQHLSVLEHSLEAEIARHEEERKRADKSQCDAVASEALVASLNEELASLRAAVDEMRDRSDSKSLELAQTLASLRQENDRLSSDLADLRGCKVEVDAVVLDLKTELARCNGVMAELVACNSTLTTLLAKLKEELSTVTLQSASVMEEHALIARTASEEKEELQSVHGEVAVLQKAVREAEAKEQAVLLEQDRMRSAFEADCARIQDELAASQSSYESLVVAFDEVTAMRHDETLQYEAAIQEWRNADSRIRGLEHELLSVTDAFEKSSREYMQQVASVQGELLANKDELERAVRDNVDISARFEQTVLQLEHATNSIVDLEAAVKQVNSRYQAEIFDLKSSHESELQSHQSASEAVLQLQERIEKLSSSKVSLETQFHATVKELKSVQRYSMFVFIAAYCLVCLYILLSSYAETLQDEVRVLHETNEIASAENVKTIVRLEAFLEAQKGSVDEMVASKKEADEKAESLGTELAELKQRIRSLESERDSLMAATALSSEEYVQVKDSLQSEVDSKVRAVEEAHSVKAQAESEVDVLKLELGKLQSKNSLLKSELSKQVVAYKTAAKEHQDFVANLNDSLGNETVSRRALEVDLDEKQKEVRALQQRIEELLGKHALEMEGGSAQAESFEAALANQSEVAARAMEDAASLQEKLDTVTRHVRELEESLEFEVSKKELEKASLSEQLALNETKISEFLLSIDALSAEKSELEGRLQEDGSASAEEISSLRGSIEQLTANNDSLHRHIESVQAECETLKIEGADALAALRLTVEEKLALVEEMEELRKSQSDAFGGEVASLTLRNDALEAELADKTELYQRSISELKDDIRSSQKDIEDLQEASALLREQASQSEAQMEALMSKIEVARQEKAELECAYDSAKHDASVLQNAMGALVDRHKQVVEEHMSDITLSDLERKSMQSILDDVQKIFDSDNPTEMILTMASFTESLSKELINLKHQLKPSDEGIERKMLDIQEVMSSHQDTIHELKRKMGSLESELQLTKKNESTLLLELQDVASRYDNASMRLLDTSRALTDAQDELATYQSHFSRIGDESVMMHSRDVSMSSSSIKLFPDVSNILSDLETPVKSSSAPEDLKHLPAISPLTASISLNQSPNKLARRIRAIVEREESEITMPFHDASIMNLIPSPVKSGEETTVTSLNPSVARSSAFPINLLASIIKPKTKLLILCDMSATMANGDRVKAQRKCVYSIANSSIENNSSLALSYWNSKLHWVVGEGEEPPYLGWRQGEQILTGFKALEAVPPEGGHDMRNALEVLLRSKAIGSLLIVSCRVLFAHYRMQRT